MRSWSYVRELAAKLNGYLVTWFHLLGWIAGAAMLAIMLVTVANVFSRIPGAPIRGTVEISSVLFVIVGAFGVGVATMAGEVIEVSLLTKRLPLRVQKVLSVIIGALGVGIWIVVTWRTLVYAIEQHRLGEYIPALHNMLTAPWRYALTFGLVMLCLALVAQFIERIDEAVKR